jgi:hypothetical protein
MEHGQIVRYFLLPPDEQPPKTVHPGVRAFDYPAAGPVARNLALRLPLLAATPDMSGIAPGCQRRAHGLVVVPLVQTQVLWPGRRRFGALDQDRLHGGVDQFHIMTISCSELILSVARLDYIADYDLDYVRIEASLG